MSLIAAPLAQGAGVRAAADPGVHLDAVHAALGGRPVLAGITLSVGAGEVIAVMGPSGSGKTTLLRVAAGLIEPDRGTRRGGERGVGYVFQDPRLLPWRTARQNVLFVLGRGARAEDRARADELLAGLGLADAADRYPAALSGGMRQRVAIARALIARPGLVLLDEPFAALDLARREQLVEELLAWLGRVGAAALWATHDPLEAARVADRVLVLPASPERGAPSVVQPEVPRPGRDDAAVAQTAHTLTRLLKGAPDDDRSQIAPATPGLGPLRRARPRGLRGRRR